MTISSGIPLVAPRLRLDHATNRPTNNKVHTLIDGTVAVTLGHPGMRTGTLTLFFLTEAESVEAETMFRDGVMFIIEDPDRPTLDMVYVLAEDSEIVRELDDDTRTRWTVSIEFQEIDA